MSGWIRFSETTLRVSSLEIFFVAGFSRTIDMALLLEALVTNDGVVKADAEASTAAKATETNFIIYIYIRQ